MTWWQQALCGLALGATAGAIVRCIRAILARRDRRESFRVVEGTEPEAPR